MPSILFCQCLAETTKKSLTLTWRCMNKSDLSCQTLDVSNCIFLRVHVCTRSTCTCVSLSDILHVCTTASRCIATQGFCLLFWQKKKKKNENTEKKKQKSNPWYHEGIGGSVVEFSPATREARVQFPANAFKIFFRTFSFLSEWDPLEYCKVTNFRPRPVLIIIFEQVYWTQCTAHT